MNRRFQGHWNEILAERRSQAQQPESTERAAPNAANSHTAAASDGGWRDAVAHLRRHRLAGLSFCLLLLLIALLLLPRDASEDISTVPVSGRVLVDGAPLTRGIVRFIPWDAPASTGKLDEQGQFSLTCANGSDGAALGVHNVEVSAIEVLGDQSIQWHAPRSYADYRTSGLEIEINGPIRDLVLELKWAQGKEQPQHDTDTKPDRQSEKHAGD